jgi:hypothetical protein
MTAVSKVSRKTTKKTGTAKTLTVMMNISRNGERDFDERRLRIEGCIDYQQWDVKPSKGIYGWCNKEVTER